jgi:L-seryl-tRNA(Ser) seleniumtransferase
MSSYRVIPSVDQLRRQPSVAALEAQYGHDAVVDALRAEAEEIRAAVGAGSPAPATATAATDTIVTRARARLGGTIAPSLKRVLNATGVIIHTNLGRAPLAASAIDRVRALAGGYTNLEYDLAEGERGARDGHAEQLLGRLTGADAAVVVNNNAAATLLALAAIAAGREVVVSRGELVEIGGGFRVPDVMAQSGALLREVGTTNKTRASDYAAAVSSQTAAILRVHPSNFRIEGFVERPALRELAMVAHRLQIPLIEDLGSGLVEAAATPFSTHPLANSEPTVNAAIAAGVDVCCFSGDKLLGGPQAGLIVGREALLQRVRKHPMMRALRVDKLTYAALDGTLAEYAAGRAGKTIPVQRMLMLTVGEIRPRAERVVEAIARFPGWRAALADGSSTVGGGSAPGVQLPTVLVSIDIHGHSPDAIEQKLRRANPPVVARIESDRVLLDLRTVSEADDPVLLAALNAIQH